MVRYCVDLGPWTVSGLEEFGGGLSKAGKQLSREMITALNAFANGDMEGEGPVFKTTKRNDALVVFRVAAHIVKTYIKKRCPIVDPLDRPYIYLVTESECQNCGHVLSPFSKALRFIVLSDYYCPQCGTKLKESPDIDCF